jgi:hypothetical protein
VTTDDQRDVVEAKLAQPLHPGACDAGRALQIAWILGPVRARRLLVEIDDDVGDDGALAA